MKKGRERQTEGRVKRGKDEIRDEETNRVIERKKIEEMIKERKLIFWRKVEEESRTKRMNK